MDNDDCSQPSAEPLKPCPMFRICKILEIENGHMLAHHPDACRFPHGHSRKVEITLEAEELDAHGMVCDFKIVKDAVGAFLDTFDHALCMNTEDSMFPTLKAAFGDRVIPFEKTEPTTEVLAKTFFETIAKGLEDYASRQDTRYRLRSAVRLASVRVWETSSSWAEYSQQLSRQ